MARHETMSSSTYRYVTKYTAIHLAPIAVDHEESLFDNSQKLIK